MQQMKIKKLPLPIIFALTLIVGFFAVNQTSASGSFDLDNAEFIPFVLHASQMANYQADDASIMMAALDMSIIMEILEFRDVSTEQAEAIYEEAHANSSSENNVGETEKESDEKESNEKESDHNNEDDSSSTPPQEDISGDAKTNNNGNGGTGNGNGKGNTTTPDDDGVENGEETTGNGNGNGNSGVGNENGNGNKKGSKKDK